MGKPHINLDQNLKCKLGPQWEHVIKILWKFHSIPLSSIGRVADKILVPLCVTERSKECTIDERTDIEITLRPPIKVGGGYKYICAQNTVDLVIVYKLVDCRVKG